jgi:maltooligosyltrehalose trehalohydrolase
VPDPQDLATFERSRLDWSELGLKEHAAVLDWHRRLIALRRSTPTLTDGRLDAVACEFDDDAGWLVVRRGPVTVAGNIGPAAVDVPVEGSIVVATDGAQLGPDGTLRLAPDAVAVLA